MFLNGLDNSWKYEIYEMLIAKLFILGPLTEQLWEYLSISFDRFFFWKGEVEVYKFLFHFEICSFFPLDGPIVEPVIVLYCYACSVLNTFSAMIIIIIFIIFLLIRLSVATFSRVDNPSRFKTKRIEQSHVPLSMCDIWHKREEISKWQKKLLSSIFVVESNCIFVDFHLLFQWH